MSDSVSADPRIGSEIAGYRIERLLGRGGMSVVYLAYDPRLDRRVALKLLASELAEDERFRERFLRESKLAASLDHPNVIPIHEAGEVGGVLFIAMRYVEGSDLAKRLAESGRLDPAEAVSILDRAADALDAAHAQGLVHRDVKPGNVLISDAGHVYLSDFGLTRRTEETVALTESGQFVGTLDYVAPEQIENREVSAVTDVYSLACVLFECLTGEVPFRGDSKMAVMFAHLQNEPPSASASNPDLPGEIDAVLARGMAKEPGGRYATCGELVEDARVALGLSGELAAPPVAGRRSARRDLLVAAAVLVVIAVAAVVAALVEPGGDGEPVVGEEWSKVTDAGGVFSGSTEVLLGGLVAGDRGFLVAVGTDGRLEEDVDGVVLTSTNGVSWTRVRDANLGGQAGQFMNGVASGPGGFVAVGAEGLTEAIYVAPHRLDAAVWTSADGVDWERVPDDEGVFGGPPFEEGVGAARRDRDLIGLPSAQLMFDVTSHESGFVAVGFDAYVDEAAVWTSPDGSAWSRLPPSAEAFGTQFELGFPWMLGVTSTGDGRLVAVGFDEAPGRVAAVWVSLDGASWTRVPHDDEVFGAQTRWLQMEDVVAGGPGFVAIGVESESGRVPFLQGVLADRAQASPRPMSAAIWTSVDGLAWSRVPDSQLPDTGGGEDVQLFAVTTGGPGLVAVGWRSQAGDVDPLVWTSQDGLTWSAATDQAEALRGPGGQLIGDVTAGGPGLVAVGADGSLLRFDAAAWTSP